ncbi:MAG TPA: serine/threonine-protein kinase [Polyangiaceae bacterium]|jgi:serine/threonine protein kinase|nr:serine/threonine-protein kinase [Polyangiaceae bacterium]
MEAPVSPGEVLAGKYRVQRVLGVGGMGVVVAADDLLLERRVAIKFLLSDALQNPEVVARFAREARSAVRIESEHVARVIDVGSLPSGSPYIVMEYLEGSDLAHHVARGALPVPEAIDYLLQACEAIAEAHALGIVHRDLKPANLFLTRRADGAAFVKVLDFGISKAASGATGSQPDMALTKTSTVMGSPMYMAPEQMRSTRAVDARADIWALGVILYELVSGKVPFEATTMPELCAMVLTEAPPPLGERCPWVPAAVVSAIDRCMQKDPAQRFGNVSELANALVGEGPEKSRLSAERISRVLRAAGIDTRSIMPSANAAQLESRPGESTSAAWAPATTGNARRTSAAPALALGVLLLVGAAVALTLLVSGHKASVEASSASAAALAAPVASAALATTEPASVTPSVTPQAVLSAPPPSAAPASAPLGSAAPPRVNVAEPVVEPQAVRRASGSLKATKAAPVPVAPPAVAAAAPAPLPPAVAAAKPHNPLDIGLK